MGNAVITENIGEGLYKAKPVYNTARIAAELARLQEINAAHFRTLLAALDSLRALRKDHRVAAEALDALIRQWEAALDDKNKPPTNPVDPDDALPGGLNPQTGEPYTPDERAAALAAQATTKVNELRDQSSLAPLALSNPANDLAARRLDAVMENADTASAKVLLSRLEQRDGDGNRPEDAWIARNPGSPGAQIAEMMAVGKDSVDGAVDAWMRDPDTAEVLMNPDATLFGLDYRHESGFPGDHVWAAAAIVPFPAPQGNTAFFAGAVGQELLDYVKDTQGQEAADALSGSDSGGGGSWGEPWKANELYGIGQVVIGSRGDNGGEVMAINYGRYGRSGATEPRWPAPNWPVGDGEVTWTVLAIILPEPIAKSIKVYYGPGGDFG